MTSFREWPSDGGPHTSDSIGQAIAGLVVRDSSGHPVPGMLAAPSVSAVASSWKVQVGRFVHVRNVSGAARFSGLSASEQVDIANASTIPGGQARIDLVCWDSTSFELVVVVGTPASSPSVPSASGMAPVVTVRVNAGDGMVVAGQVAPAFELTSLVGGKAANGVVAKRNVVANGTTNVNVSFPAGLFTEVPVVLATVWGDARDTVAQVDSITTAGFVLRLGSTAPRARSIGAQWRAEQM